MYFRTALTTTHRKLKLSGIGTAPLWVANDTQQQQQQQEQHYDHEDQDEDAAHARRTLEAQLQCMIRVKKPERRRIIEQRIVKLQALIEAKTAAGNSDKKTEENDSQPTLEQRLKCNQKRVIRVKNPERRRIIGLRIVKLQEKMEVKASGIGENKTARQAHPHAALASSGGALGSLQEPRTSQQEQAPKSNKAENH